MYGTLESNRLHLGDGVTIGSVVPPISGETWVDHLNKQGDQHLFVVVTKEEFESMNASAEGVLNTLNGSVRQRQGMVSADLDNDSRRRHPHFGVS